VDDVSDAAFTFARSRAIVLEIAKMLDLLAPILAARRRRLLGVAMCVWIPVMHLIRVRKTSPAKAR